MRQSYPFGPYEYQLGHEPPADPGPLPNLRGDDYHFVRYEPMQDRPGYARVLNHGHMHRDHIDAERSAGVLIAIVDDRASTEGHILNLETMKLEEVEPPKRQVIVTVLGLRVAIERELAASDHYFLDDRDNIPAREAWQPYRKALRAAHNLESVADMLQAIPPTNPRGIDPFSAFRSNPEVMKEG